MKIRVFVKLFLIAFALFAFLNSTFWLVSLLMKAGVSESDCNFLGKIIGIFHFVVLAAIFEIWKF